MKVLNSRNNKILAEECRIAFTFKSRFFGLMGKSNLSQGSGLHIIPCNSIHMFFMRMPLDIIFLNKDRKIVYLIEDIKPWRVSKIIKKAHSVLELPVGSIKTSESIIGDEIIFFS